MLQVNQFLFALRENFLITWGYWITKSWREWLCFGIQEAMYPVVWFWTIYRPPPRPQAVPLQNSDQSYYAYYLDASAY